jgi:hypothetical protein
MSLYSNSCGTKNVSTRLNVNSTVTFPGRGDEGAMQKTAIGEEYLAGEKLDSLPPNRQCQSKRYVSENSPALDITTPPVIGALEGLSR